MAGVLSVRPRLESIEERAETTIQVLDLSVVRALELAPALGRHLELATHGGCPLHTVRAFAGLGVERAVAVMLGRALMIDVGGMCLGGLRPRNQILESGRSWPAGSA